MRGQLTRREFLEKGLLPVLGVGLASCAGSQRLAEITPSKLTEPAAPPSDFTPAPSPKSGLKAEAGATPIGEGTGIPEGLHEARYYVQLDR